MEPNLRGRVALVTGSAKGIGRGIAMTLARHGVKVLINYRRSSLEAKEVVSQIRKMGGDAFSAKADVTDSADARLLIKKSVSRWGRLDMLINNVGDFLIKDTSLTKPEEWRKIVDSNLISTVNCTYYAVKEMRKRKWGRIVNIGFAKSERVQSFPRIAAYASSKAAVLIFTKSLARDLAPFGITVNAVSPGIMGSSALEKELQERMLKKVPSGRIGKPEDVASCVLWLVSDKASYVTGANIVVSGGWGI